MRDCILDACMLTNNQVNCDNGRGEEFGFAQQNVEDKRDEIYPIAPIHLCQCMYSFYYFPILLNK